MGLASRRSWMSLSAASTAPSFQRVASLLLPLLLISVWMISEQQQQRLNVNAFSFVSFPKRCIVSPIHITTTSTVQQTIASSRSLHPPKTSSSYSSTALFAKSRKARRQDKKQQQSLGRSTQFYEALEQAGAKTPSTFNGEEAATTSTTTLPNEDGSDPTPPSSPTSQQQSSQKATAPVPVEDPAAQARRNAIQQDAEERYMQRPEVSTMIVDEETGTEVLAQGQKVMDVVTRKAVKLADTPQQRLEQMFPTTANTELRNKYRFDWRTITVPEMLEQWKEASYITLPDGTRGTPEHPSIANKAIQFVLANRDYMGPRMKKILARWTMHCASNNDWEAAREWKQVWDHFLLAENHVSAPFRQILQDAEGRVGPNFGNLDLKAFCKGDLYVRIGNYLVLKGMVAHWEKKVVDANFYEKEPQPDDNYMRWLGTGDPKRYLAEPPILWTLAECAQVCAKAQEMCQLFVQDDELFADFPPEIVFLEEALRIKGGTALRKYMIDEFCPSRGITQEALREGMRRFHHQLDNMQIDPYADLTNKVELLYRAMAIGTDDERDPYEKYLGIEASTDPSNPAYFETYTFNTPKASLIRFFDSQYPEREGFSEMVGPKPTKPEAEETSSSTSSIEKENPFAMDNPFDFSNLFGGGNDESGGGSSENPLESLFGSLTGNVSREKQLRREPNPEADKAPYDAPRIRRIGRPHELGWLDQLAELDKHKVSFGKVQPGRIIPDDEA